MVRRILPLVLLVVLAACDQGRTSAPTLFPFPSQPGVTVASRRIVFSGTLSFGTIDIGTSASLTIRVENRGTDTVTISGMTSPLGFQVDWETGTIPAGSGVALTVTFSPEDARPYGGLLVVFADVTAGDNRIGVTGTGRTPSEPPSSHGQRGSE